MKQLDSISGSGKRIAAIGLAMLGISASILILAFAVKALSSTPWQELLYGIGAISALIAAVALAAKLMRSEKEDLAKTGFALIGLAVAVLILTFSIKKLGGLPWEVIKHGLGGLAASLILMAGALRVVDEKQATAKGIAFVLLAFSLRLFAKAVEIFGHMDVAVLQQGFIAIFGLLAGLVLAMNAMPKNLDNLAFGLILVAASVLVMTKALESLGNMKGGDMYKALWGMALGLLILVVALNAMNGTAPGAFAMVLAAGALLVLGAAFGVIGQLDWGQILKGVAVMGAFFAAILIAGAIGSLVFVGLLAIGVAIAGIGLGLKFMGEGALAAAKALKIFSQVGRKSFDNVKKGIETLKKIMPELVGLLVASIFEFGKQFLAQIPQIIDLLRGVLEAALGLIVELGPQLFQVFGVLLDGVLNLLIGRIPKFVELGWTMLLSFAKGIKDNIGELAVVAAEAIIKFNEGIASKMPEVTFSALKVLFTFMTTILQFMPAIIEHGAKLLVAFLNGIKDNLSKVIPAVLGLLAKFITEVAANIGPVIDAGVNLLVQFLTGIENNLGKIAAKVIAIILRFVAEVSSENNITALVGAGATLLTNLLDGLAEAVKNNSQKFSDAAANVIEELTAAIVSAGIKMGPAIIAGIGKGVLGVFNRSAPEKSGSYFEDLPVKPTPTNDGPDDIPGRPPRGLNEANKRLTETFGSRLARSMSAAADGIGKIAPTISPVLDLSDVEREAARLGGILGVSSLDPSMSYGQARQLAHTSDKVDTPAPAPAGETHIEFNQTINSPKPLNAAAVYRGTKSQIARAKEEIKIA